MDFELLSPIAQGLDRGLLVPSDFDTAGMECTSILAAHQDLSTALYRRDEGAVLRSERYCPTLPVLEVSITLHVQHDRQAHCGEFQPISPLDAHRLNELLCNRASRLDRDTFMVEDCCLRIWERGPFRLELFASPCECTGTLEVAYRFSHDGRVIFVEDHLGVPDDQCIDGDETVCGALNFIVLAPGDVDSAYFANYSRDQIAWRDKHAEALALAIFEAFGK